MGRKTPISFNLQKYNEKHCNSPLLVISENFLRTIQKSNVLAIYISD